jgi:uncharacterized membrane protein
MDYSEIRQEARNALSGNWLRYALITFVYCIFALIIMYVDYVKEYFGQFLMILVSGAFAVSFCRISLQILASESIDLDDLFYGFRMFVKSLAVNLLATLFTLLWMLLLIIPGIIAAYSYSMAFYILVEDPDIRPMDAINLSKEMMKGHKWELFVLHLTFIGWAILNIFTIFIGTLWLGPYINVSTAIFYRRIKAEYEGVQEVPVIENIELDID